MRTYGPLAAALLLFAAAALLCQAAPAADFRVDNAIYAEGHSRPQSKGTTIFHKGFVYAFLDEPAEVIIFDKVHRQFVLLDPVHHLRSEITFEEVEAFVNRVGQRLSAHANPNIRWLADPTFDESFDTENSELTLKGAAITYEAHLQSALPAVAAEYCEFSDWYAMLNQFLDTKTWPPFPRMALDAAIQRRQAIAKEVHLVAALHPKDPTTRITARHQLTPELDSADIRRLAEVREYLKGFKDVSFREFRQAR